VAATELLVNCFVLAVRLPFWVRQGLMLRLSRPIERLLAARVRIKYHTGPFYDTVLYIIVFREHFYGRDGLHYWCPMNTTHNMFGQNSGHAQPPHSRSTGTSSQSRRSERFDPQKISKRLWDSLMSSGTQPTNSRVKWSCKKCLIEDY